LIAAVTSILDTTRRNGGELSVISYQLLGIGHETTRRRDWSPVVSSQLCDSPGVGVRCWRLRCVVVAAVPPGTRTGEPPGSTLDSKGASDDAIKMVDERVEEE